MEGGGGNGGKLSSLKSASSSASAAANPAKKDGTTGRSDLARCGAATTRRDGGCDAARALEGRQREEHTSPWSLPYAGRGCGG
eukprot:3370786-Prymnesium_polylepis.2